jgi:hypothetical protein
MTLCEEILGMGYTIFVFMVSTPTCFDCEFWPSSGSYQLGVYGTLLRALVNVVMKLQVPYNAGKFFSSSGHVIISRRTLLFGVGLVSYVAPYYM